MLVDGLPAEATPCLGVRRRQHRALPDPARPRAARDRARARPRHGFWGCVADGASFRTLVGGGRKRTRPGVEIIRAHIAEIDAAEHDFHRHIRLYLHGEDSTTRAALDAVLAQWRSLSEHESFELEFPVVAAPRRSGRTIARARGRRV